MVEDYGTDNIMISWGEDFGFYNANQTYGLIDDIFAYLYEKVPGYLNLNILQFKSLSMDLNPRLNPRTSNYK